MASFLQVCAEIPYPPQTGGRADVLSRGMCLKQLGHAVHLFFMQPTRPVEESALTVLRERFDSVTVVPRLPLKAAVLHPHPTLSRRNRPLSTCDIPSHIDIILAESEHVAEVFQNPRLKTSIRILRLHNDESAYMSILARLEPRLWKRAFFWAEAFRFRGYSRKVFEQANFIWAISRHEADVLRHRLDIAGKVRWLPPIADVSNRPRNLAPLTAHVLFVGNLQSSINQEALEWYLSYIHPVLLSEPDYFLNVVGNMALSSAMEPAPTSIFARIKNTERCAIYANVESLNDLYFNNQVFANPMQRGAGVKIKNVHAAAQGIPIVSTTTGNEGTGLLNETHIAIANEPEAFAHRTLELLRDSAGAQAMANRARDFINEHYSPSTLQTLVMESFESTGQREIRG